MLPALNDAVGSPGYNLDLSRKRAEAVKNALVEYFVISPDNLATIGYGEQFLKIPTPEDESENRRVSVRRISPPRYQSAPLGWYATPKSTRSRKMRSSSGNTRPTDCA